MARRVTLTEDTARRMAAATRAYERGNRDQSPIRFRQVSDDGDPLVIGRTTAQWTKGTTQELTVVYALSCDDEASPDAGTVQAHNKSHTVSDDVLVLVARAANGCWYLVGAESSCIGIGGEDLTSIPGYDAEKTQILGHQTGCLKWIDTFSCD